MNPQRETWPLVDPNDDGIRPAGRSDECLYCRSRVGQLHGEECVIVTKRVEVRVRASFEDATTGVEGTWQFDEPYFWDADMTDFHKNESSWCAGNLLHEEDEGSVHWQAPDTWAKLRQLDDAGSCLCNNLAFEFLRVVDNTPRRKLRTTSARKGDGDGT